VTGSGFPGEIGRLRFPAMCDIVQLGMHWPCA